MGYSSPDAAFIIDLDGGGMFPFQFIPETISDSKSASFNDYDILGRSIPLKGYRGSPSRTLQFTVRMWTDPTADGAPLSVGQIKQRTDFLRSLVYADYSGGIKPPHKCLITIGLNFQMIGVCTQAAPTVSRNSNVWDLGPTLSHGMEVQLTFEEVGDVPLSTFEVRAGAF